VPDDLRTVIGKLEEKAACLEQWWSIMVATSTKYDAVVLIRRSATYRLIRMPISIDSATA
jgi:hypothetical protein